MRRLLLAIAFILSLPALANAQTFPAFTQTDTYSNVGWSVNTTRGWSFTVSSRIVVDQLGFWDSGQDGLATPHGVGIWRGDGTLLTSTTVPAGSGAPLDGTFRWSPTSAVLLEPGNLYVVGAYWSSGNPDTTLATGESVVFDSRVNLVEGRAINTVGLFYPAQTALVDLTANFKAHPAPNQPPVANAGPDRNAYTGVWTTLQGSATDPENDPIIGWAWEIVQTPPGGRARLLSQEEQNLQFLGYVEGDYVMSLTAWDGMSPFVGVDYATVQVRDNVPPIAVATADQTTIHVGDTVCFDGSQSHDPEGAPISFYVWDFGDLSAQVLGVSACHVFDQNGTFGATLFVYDERNATGNDVIMITVDPAPAVPALPRSGLWLLGLLLSLAGAAQISRRGEGRA